MPAETKDSETKTVSKTRNTWIEKPGKEWLYVLAAVIVVLLAYGIGYAAATNHYDNQKVTTRGFYARSMGDGPVTIGHGGAMMGSGQYGTRTMFEDSDHFHGVVTAVSGANFTIAGSGASTNVVTSGSTSYQNGNAVKQNDSVIIEGSKSGDTITATKVIINP
jgi:hypothetical protein